MLLLHGPKHNDCQAELVEAGLFKGFFTKTGHNYYVYIIQCSDGSYYTGVTNNLERRLWEHQEGYIKSCYTYTRRPVELKYSEHYHNINNAIAREKQLKGWSRKKKEALFKEDWEEIKKLAKSKAQPDSTPKDQT